MAFDLSAVSPIAFKLHLEILSDRPFSSYSLGPAIQHVPARSGDDTRASSVAAVFASLPFHGVLFFLISSLRPFPNQAPPSPQRKDDDNTIPVGLFSFPCRLHFIPPLLYPLCQYSPGSSLFLVPASTTRRFCYPGPSPSLLFPTLAPSTLPCP